MEIIVMIISSFSIILGLRGLIYTLKHKNNMPYNLYGIAEEKYEVINEKRFNKLLIIQGYTLSSYLIFLGILGFIYKSTNVVMFFGSSLIILVVFRFLAHKHIKLYKK